MISTKTVKSKQTDGVNRPGTPRRRGVTKKNAARGHPSKRATKGPAEPARAPRRDSKQQLCLHLLGRPEGASLEDLQLVTGWQAHTVRGFVAGTLKKMGVAVESFRTDGKERTYRVAK